MTKLFIYYWKICLKIKYLLYYADTTTPARFEIQLFIHMEMGYGAEWGRECEAGLRNRISERDIERIQRL